MFKISLSVSGNENGHDAKKDTDLRNFIRLRLDVCQRQLLNFQDAIDEYKRNGAFKSNKCLVRGGDLVA